MASKKITLDKYYSPQSIADYCTQKAIEVIGIENITELVESSAGKGSFLNSFEKFLPNIPYQAYDIEPEEDRIVKQDFLKTNIKYLEGRLVITNPPYGRCLNMAQKFFKKSIEMAEYVAFILPISQLNNNNYFYEYDLIHSVDLGEQIYTNRKLHCCFNIHKKPEYGNNKKPNFKLKDIEIIRQDSKKYKESKYDLRFCYWGDGTAGKILKEGENYAGEYKIIIKNEKFKNNILNVFNTYNWKDEIDRISMRRIKQWQILKILKEKIPELE